jgi:fused signal recognition particle receptor
MFKFLKRLRGEKDTPTPVAAVTEEVVEEVIAPAVAVLVEEPKPQPVVEVVEQEKSPTEPVAVVEKVVEAPEIELAEVELAEVELPKRTLGSGIRSLFGASIDIEALEDILIRADFGVDASVEITEQLRKEANRTGANTEAQLRLLLKDLLTARLTRSDSALNLSSGDLPYVILVVGVNGAGKTTTIGKLSRWLKDGDWSVVLGAADTFRAAAVDQLATWAQRAEAKIVRPEREGQDPAAVAYQTVELALREQADIDRKSVV